MAHTIQLTDGTTAHTVSLEYAAGSQENYKTLYYRQRQEIGIVPQEHRSDAMEDGAEPFRFTRENREWYLTLAVYGTNRNDHLNNINALSRILNMAGNVRTFTPKDKYYLSLTLNGATNYTRYDCKLGKIMDDTGIYEPESLMDNVTVPVAKIIVLIVTEPRGYGAEETLSNRCREPEFMNDTDGDGLADYWMPVSCQGYKSVNETFALDTTYYLCGGKSQKVTLVAGGFYSGIKSINYPITGGSDCCARIAYTNATDDRIVIELAGNNGGTIDVAYNAEDGDSTEIGYGGKTWKIYDLSGTSDVGDTSVYITVYGEEVATGTFYVDKVYLNTTSATLPTAWSSYYEIQNHYDEGYNLVANQTMETNILNWNQVGTPSTFTQSAEQAHTDNESLKFIVDAANEGAKCDAFTTVTGQWYFLTLWVYPDDTAATTITLYQGNDGSTAIFDQSVAMTQDAWNRVAFWYQEPAGGASAAVQIDSGADTAGTYYIDDVYVYSESHINYLSVDDIPGSEPALTKIEAGISTVTSVPVDWPNAIQYFIAHHNANPGDASDYVYNVTGSETGHRHYNITSNITSSWGTLVGMSWDDDFHVRGEYNLMVCVNDRDTAAGQIRAKYRWGSGGSYTTTEAKTLATYQKWVVEMIGPINLNWPDVIADTGSGETLRLEIVIQAKHVANTADIWVDFVHLFATHGGFSITRCAAAVSDMLICDNEHIRDGSYWKLIGTYLEQNGRPDAEYPYLEPGMYQRLHFMLRGLDDNGNYHDPDFLGDGEVSDFGKLALKYMPRTSTLLGTT